MGFGNSKQVGYNQKYRSLDRMIARRACENPKRRARYEADTPKWLKYYLGSAYPAAWGDMHLQIIAGAEEAVRTGGKGGCLAPRGSGKSSVLWGVALKLVLTGAVRFPVVLPWAAKDLRKTLRFFKNALCFNERLAADYPDYCQPFAQSGGSSQKCLTLLWEETGNSTGAEIRMSDGMIIFPDGLGAIGSATINGNPKGLNHTTKTGVVLRPDFCLIDDPQDKEVAKSPTLVAATIDVIDTDVLGMAGPECRMPAFMAITASRPGDVAEHYRKAQDWVFICIPQILTWPKNRKAWDDLGALLLDQKETDALKVYKANKDVMLEGLTVSWADRYDKKRKEPDACYSAMRDFYIMGESAFMSERQNEPMELSTSSYELKPETVATHIAKRQRYELPEQARIIVAATDINRKGLHWVVVGFDQQMSAHYCVYGKYPERGDVWEENAPELVRKQKIFTALGGLCSIVASLPLVRNGQRVICSRLTVDRGYEPDVVHRFCAQSRFPFHVIPARGYASHKYCVHKSTLVGSPYEQCHILSSTNGQFIAWNSDHWREVMQRAWLGDAGTPGGATLFEGNQHIHQLFSEHITAERLKQKYKTDSGMRWEWVMRPGTHNDYADAANMAYVAAASAGLNSCGIQNVTGKRRELRKAKVDIEE